MPRAARELGAREVSLLSEPGLHAVGGVAGLHLRIKPTGAKGWILRVVVGNKRRDIGLGGYSQSGMTLAKARAAALEKRDTIAKGIDPVEQKVAANSAMKAAQARELSFKDAAHQYIKAHEAGWRNAKHAQQYRNTLEAYAYPVMGDLLVRDVDLAHVLQVLEPIWETKTETASRLRGRMEAVLDWAKGRRYRSGDNPAAWKGNLDAQLPRRTRVAKVRHRSALPVEDAGAFIVELRAAEGMGARALEFAILTAARSGEVRGATWGEIDKSAKVWSVPGPRMKAGKEHRVPLSAAAVKLLKALPRIAPAHGQPDYVFPALRGGQLSDATLQAVVHRMNEREERPRWVDPKNGGREVVPHGFRTTFRDWTAEHTNYPNHVCEMALAHVVGDKVEAAYRRGDLFDKRRRMMDDWATFLATPITKGKVIPMKRARA